MSFFVLKELWQGEGLVDICTGADQVMLLKRESVAKQIFPFRVDITATNYRISSFFDFPAMGPLALQLSLPFTMMITLRLLSWEKSARALGVTPLR